MDIYFSISHGSRGHFICCYNQDGYAVNKIVRNHAARVWRSLAEAEQFALDQGWHPITDEMSSRLHADEGR